MKTYSVSVPVNATLEFAVSADDEDDAAHRAELLLGTILNLDGIELPDMTVAEDAEADITAPMRWVNAPTVLDADVLASEDYVRNLIVDIMKDDIYEEAERRRSDDDGTIDETFDTILDETIRAMAEKDAFRDKLRETIFDDSRTSSVLQDDVDAVILDFVREHLRARR